MQPLPASNHHQTPLPDPRVSIEHLRCLLLEAPRDLRRYGFDPSPRERSSYGRRIAAEAQSEAEYAELVLEVAACARFFIECTEPIKTERYSRGSYDLKHDIEHWVRTPSVLGRHLYIANGSAIAAALLLGLRVWPGVPNANVGVRLRKPPSARSIAAAAKAAAKARAAGGAQ